jgi:mannitol/fructose-specific phosphotransferase system IIA component (Ntr-type)
LHSSPADLERLVKDGEIPCEHHGTRVTFRRKDIDAWASQRILGLPGQALRAYHATSSARIKAIPLEGPMMPQLITVDRIDHELHSRTRGSVMRDLVALAESTDLVADPRELLDTLEERERLCSTALPGGIALLHPRHHAPYMFSESFIVLGRPLQPVHFGAPDGHSTDLFFLLCCQDDRIHLHALARLCMMFQHTGLILALRSAETAADMLTAILLAEEEVLKTMK